jgi:hypothetical protein
MFGLTFLDFWHKQLCMCVCMFGLTILFLAHPTFRARAIGSLAKIATASDVGPFRRINDRSRRSNDHKLK